MKKTAMVTIGYSATYRFCRYRIFFCINLSRKLYKSAYLREILKKGFEEDKSERLLSRYQAGELSAAEICKMLGVSPWEFFDLLKKKNMSLNVSLEDLLDSGKLA